MDRLWNVPNWNTELNTDRMKKKYYNHTVTIKVSTEESNKKLDKVLSEGKSIIIIRKWKN